MKKKRAFTLMEIMLVIFLIGIIGSIVGYNMKGSLDEGKAFKTEQAIVKVQDLLELELARGASAQNIENNPEGVLDATNVVKKPKAYLKDGWGEPLKIKVRGNDVHVESKKLKEFKARKAQKRGYDLEEEEE